MESTTIEGTTDDAAAAAVPYYLVERVIEAAILTVIFVVAFTGNMLLWMVVFRRQSLRTSSNALILCLSGADLLVSTINMPVTIYTILQGEWIFGESMCTFFGFLNMVTFIGSVVSLAAISINRYILIVHPNKFRVVYTRRNTALVIVGVWTLSFSLASPPLFGWASYKYLQGQSFCFCRWKDSISYTFFMVGVCFGGPCSVMTYCYTKILRVFKKSQRNVSQDVSTTHRSGSFGSAKDNCVVKLRTKFVANQRRRRRQSLPDKSNSLPTKVVENGCYGGLELPGRGDKAGSTGLVRKNRPMTSFQHLNDDEDTNSLKVVSSNANNAAVNDSSILSSPSPSADILENNPVSPTSPDYTTRDADTGTRRSSKWTSLFKKSTAEKKSQIVIRLPATSSGIQPDGISTDEFSNPFANSACPPDIAAQAALNGQRSVPAGLYGTPNGPSTSRMARKRKRREEEMRLTKSFMVVICVFILCWFPFCITMFWSVFIKDESKSVPRVIDMATLLLGFANSCCNPIIYGVMNRKFRAGFKSLICWWRDCNVVNPWNNPPNP